MVFIYIIIICFLGYAVLSDIRYRRIPNFLCLLILIIGITANVFAPTGEGLYLSLLGFVAGFLPILVLYILTGLGAGDVKLMAVIGSVVGFKAILLIFYYSFMISGLYAVFYLIFKGRAMDIVRYYGSFFTELLHGSGQVLCKKPVKKSTKKYQMPMAPGIALATIYVLLPKIMLTAGNEFSNWYSKWF